jgi:hypothetical protein
VAMVVGVGLRVRVGLYERARGSKTAITEAVGSVDGQGLQRGSAKLICGCSQPMSCLIDNASSMLCACSSRQFASFGPLS